MVGIYGFTILLKKGKTETREICQSQLNYLKLASFVVAAIVGGKHLSSIRSFFSFYYKQ